MEKRFDMKLTEEEFAALEKEAEHRHMTKKAILMEPRHIQTEKSPDLDSFNIEVEQKQRQIYVLIKCKDPLDALDLAHAVMFSETMKPLKASWKVLP